jgi:hypothetical protein
MARIVLGKETATPTTPTTGYVKFYAEGTNLKYVDDTGTVYTLATGITPEDVQDIVGAMLTDSSSIDFTYNDPANTFTATVIAGGVDHNSLLNYVSNQHINHASVTITGTGALTGGGDLTASRTISLANTAVSPGSYGSSTAVGTFTVDAQGRLTAAANTPISAAGIGAQPLDADLTALASLAGTGFAVRTAADTWTTRNIVAGTGTSVTNGDGVSGNTSVNLTSTGVTSGSYGSASSVSAVTVDSFGRITAASSTPIAIAQSQVTGLVTDLSNKQPLSAELTAEAGQTTTGIQVRTGAGARTTRTIVGTAPITVSNGDGVAANPTISLANTAVTPGSYGSSTQLSTFTVDAQGRITAAGQVTLNPSLWVNSGGFYAYNNDTGDNLRIYQASATDSAYVEQVRSRGTIASPTALLSGDRIGSNGYIGWTTSGLGIATADISAWATENYTAAAQGSELRFGTTANGTAAETVRVIVQNDGNLSVQSNRIVNLATPINPTDAVTKAYVDGGGSAWTELNTTSDLTNASNVTFSTITPLNFSVVAGRRYRIEAILMFRTAATGTGIAFTANTTNTAAGTFSLLTQIPQAGDGTGSTFSGTINAFNDIVTSTAVAVANANYIATINGVFVATASGTVALQFRSEVNGSTVTLANGSNILVRDFG